MKFCHISKRDNEIDINSSAISTWYDINPQATTSNNATQNGISSLRPVYNFSGSSTYMNFNGTDLAQTNYTISIK